MDIRVALTTSGGTGVITGNGTIRLLSVRCSLLSTPLRYFKLLVYSFCRRRRHCK